MIKTQWILEDYNPEKQGVVKAASPEQVIEEFIETYGPTQVEALIAKVGKSPTAVRHILRNMKQQGRIVSKRMRIAGNVTYWAFTQDDIEALDLKLPRRRKL